MGIGFRELLILLFLVGIVAVPILIYRQSAKAGKRFAVYEHPVQGFEAVKIGFSWPAFFFGFFWMLAKKLWKLAGMWFAFYMISAFFETVADESPASGAQALVYLILFGVYMLLWLLPAIRGNQWREADLVRRGYERGPTVNAQTPEAAVAQSVRQAAPAAATG